MFNHPLQSSLLPETLQDPLFIAVATLVIIAAVAYQRDLTYREYREWMRLKRRLFPILDRLEPFGFSSFVHEKDVPKDDDEFYAHTDLEPRELWRRLTAEGGDPHLVSSLKRRPVGQLSKWHFVWMHGDGTQSEVYIFPDGAVYVHHETGVQDVDGHLSDGIEAGDVRGVLDDVEL
jgi:hypothetical protein